MKFVLLLLVLCAALCECYNFGPVHTYSIGLKNIDNLYTVRDELSYALGYSWSSLEVYSEDVYISECGQTESITFYKFTTTRGNPFVELLTASPYQKPWLGGAMRSSTFVWGVNNITTAGEQILSVSDFSLVAEKTGEYAYYAMSYGLQLKVVRSDLLPDPINTTNTPPVNTTDLGKPDHMERATKIGQGPHPDSFFEVRDALGQATGMTWLNYTQFFDSQYTLPGGSTVLVDNRIVLTEERPGLELLSADPSIQPWRATNTKSDMVLGFAVNDLPAARNQILGAGMALVIELVFAGTDFLSFYETSVDDVQIEIVLPFLIPT